MTMRVLFYVQHLLGIGHLTRASRIAAALTNARTSVTMVSGGMPVDGFPGPGVDLVQLPPLRTDRNFSGLIGETGAPADEALRNLRRDMLLETLAATRPDAVVIEAFPFARHQMRFELIPLLDAARTMQSKPLVVSSVRDIIQRSGKPDRVQKTVDTVQTYFDLVLVHGDETFARLSDSFPEARAFDDRIIHTGLVAGPAATSRDHYAVVVSAGGGAVGGELALAALAARPLSRYADKPWLIVTGPNAPQDLFDELTAAAPAGVGVERFRNDFPGLLANAELSVSQAGYNTVCDILRAGCRSVLIPFAAGGETEQSERAAKLEHAGRAAVIAETDISASLLAAAIDRAPGNKGIAIGLDGAANTARIIIERVGAR